MRFEILDVGHGFCAYLETDNDNLVVFDCGYKTDPEFRPSLYLHNRGHRSTERLFVTNYDEDHISDLPQLKKRLPVRILHRNKSISPEQLRRLKLESGPITPAMFALLEMMQTYSCPATSTPEPPDFDWESYAHPYGDDFDDTNNISLVTFVRVRDVHIVIPGDLERRGWEKHLENSHFLSALDKVDVFVTSHHGRENGYCPQVFDYCEPHVIIISDGPKQHATQEMVDRYASHAIGVPFNGQTRRVLTTRKDGCIWWDL